MGKSGCPCAVCERQRRDEQSKVDKAQQIADLQRVRLESRRADREAYRALLSLGGPAGLPVPYSPTPRARELADALARELAPRIDRYNWLQKRYPSELRALQLEEMRGLYDLLIGFSIPPAS